MPPRACGDATEELDRRRRPRPAVRRSRRRGRSDASSVFADGGRAAMSADAVLDHFVRRKAAAVLSRRSCPRTRSRRTGGIACPTDDAIVALGWRAACPCGRCRVVAQACSSRPRGGAWPARGTRRVHAQSSSDSRHCARGTPGREVPGCSGMHWPRDEIGTTPRTSRTPTGSGRRYATCSPTLPTTRATAPGDDRAPRHHGRVRNARRAPADERDRAGDLHHERHDVGPGELRRVEPIGFVRRPLRVVIGPSSDIGSDGLAGSEDADGGVGVEHARVAVDLERVERAAADEVEQQVARRAPHRDVTLGVLAGEREAVGIEPQQPLAVGVGAVEVDRLARARQRIRRRRR